MDLSPGLFRWRTERQASTVRSDRDVKSRALDGKVVMALADVTGHGVGPALLAAVCRAYGRANFSSSNGLFSGMERIDAAVSIDVGEGRFVTFVAAVCDPASSCVQLLSAGRGPLLLFVSKEDRFEQMGAQRPPLGIVPSLISEPPRVLELNSGDMLVLVTDGFFEWGNAQEELFGLQRMHDVIRISKDKTRSELLSDGDCILRRYETARRSHRCDYQANVEKTNGARVPIYLIKSSRRRRLSRGLRSICQGELPPRQPRDLVQP
jgi:serine phosphatase RsbU (regulator of sigma subunit)